MTHALAIGATGMLADAVRELARRGFDITLVARDERRLERVARSCRTGTVRSVSFDYQDVDGLAQLVRDVEARHQPFTVAMAWIHGTAPGAHEAVAEVLGRRPPRCRYLEVLGSASRSPATLGRERAQVLRGLPFLDHCRVILGHDPAGTWLSDEAISAGVIQALDAAVDEHVVGTLEPYGAGGAAHGPAG